MALAHLDEATPAALGLGGTVLLLPVGHANAQSTEYSWKHLPQLLDPGQYLLVDLEERCLTLRQGRRVLVQALLRPLTFRLFLALLVAHQQGKTSSYAALLALKEADEEQMAALLGGHEAKPAWLEAATEAQKQALETIQAASTREQVLKPMRRAIREPGGLGPVLAAHGFPWEVQNRYGRGYRLARLPISAPIRRQQRG